MNDNQTVPNVALREHVTGFAFTLTMPKSAVWFLDAIAHCDRNRNRRVPCRFISGAHACQDRGLIEHRHAPNWIGEKYVNMEEPITNYYRLTKAGWLMHDLLAECGMVEAVSDKRLRKVIAA